MEKSIGPISPVVAISIELINDDEKAHNPSSKKLGRATLKISTSIYGRNLKYFKDKGIRLMILELPATTQDLSALDASVANMITETINDMLIEMYSTMVLAGIEKKNKGQQEGFAAKKARGEWEDYGRPRIQKPSNWDYVISQWKKGNITAVEAMEQTNLKKTTFYKLLKE